MGNPLPPGLLYYRIKLTIILPPTDDVYKMGIHQ